MTSYKEIVTKAVIGKSRKTSTSEYTIIPDVNPDTVLGCWIINHNFKGINNNGQVLVNGSFDVNVWYSFNDDKETKVSHESFSYQDVIPVSIKEEGSFDDTAQVIVRSLRQPSVTEVKIEDGKIVMNIEKELGVEVVGDAKLTISVEEDEDEYEIITDDYDNKDMDDITEEYLDS